MGVNSGTLIEALPHADYHARGSGPPRLSASIARILLNDSPRHAFLAHPALGGATRSKTRIMDRGSVLHQLCLGGELDVHLIQATYENPKHERFGEVVTDFKTKAAQEERDAHEAAGKVVMLAREMDPLKDFARDTADRLRAGVKVNGASGPVRVDIDSGKRELSCFFSADGVSCKARLDHFDGAVISDLKFTASANPKWLGRHIYDMGLEVEMAAHTEAIECAKPELAGRVSSQLVFCEVESPHLITIVQMNGEWRELGQLRWTRAKEIWARCIERNEWPGYEDTYVEPPAYAMKLLFEAA